MSWGFRIVIQINSKRVLRLYAIVIAPVDAEFLDTFRFGQAFQRFHVGCVAVDLLRVVDDGTDGIQRRCRLVGNLEHVGIDVGELLAHFVLQVLAGSGHLCTLPLVHGDAHAPCLHGAVRLYQLLRMVGGLRRGVFIFAGAITLATRFI